MYSKHAICLQPRPGHTMACVGRGDVWGLARRQKERSAKMPCRLSDLTRTKTVSDVRRCLPPILPITRGGRRCVLCQVYESTQGLL